MTKQKNKFGFYVLMLSIVVGAVLAAFVIHLVLHNRKDRIDLGDSTHGYFRVHDSLAEIGNNKTRNIYDSTETTINNLGNFNSN